jgi:hypothetical protein
MKMKNNPIFPLFSSSSDYPPPSSYPYSSFSSLFYFSPITCFVFSSSYFNVLASTILCIYGLKGYAANG